MMHGARAMLVSAACLAVAACAEPDSMPLGPMPLGADFGNAVSHNAAQHIIEPDPASARSGAPDLDGARAGDAIRRYRAGAVTTSEAIETTTFGQTR